MLTEIYDGQAALEAALLADLSRDRELTRIQNSFERIADKLTILLNGLNERKGVSHAA